MNIHPVKGFRLDRREWFKMIETFLRDQTIKAVQEECRIAHETASKAVHAIREVMTNDVP